MLSMHRSLANVEPMVGLAAPSWPVGAKEGDARVPAGVILTPKPGCRASKTIRSLAVTGSASTAASVNRKVDFCKTVYLSNEYLGTHFP